MTSWNQAGPPHRYVPWIPRAQDRVFPPPTSQQEAMALSHWILPGEWPSWWMPWWHTRFRTPPYKPWMTWWDTNFGLGIWLKTNPSNGAWHLILPTTSWPRIGHVYHGCHGSQSFCDRNNLSGKAIKQDQLDLMGRMVSQWCMICFPTMSQVGEPQTVLFLFIEYTHLVFVQCSTLELKRWFTLLFLILWNMFSNLKRNLLDVITKSMSIWT